MVDMSMRARSDQDRELVEAARRGERAAFDALFGGYLALVRGEARRCGLRATVGDAIQETFLRAYMNLAELRDPARFASWLRTIAQRVCATELRHDRRAEAFATQTRYQPAHPDANHTELRELLARLPPCDREPLHLHYVLGLDTAAAAKAMGIRPGAFRVRLHRARERARDLAASRRIEEMLIMTGQSKKELAEQLAQTACGAVRDERPAAPKDWKRYRANLEQAVKTDPDCQEAAFDLARKLSRDGEYRRAIKLLDKLWADGQRSPWATLTMAWSLDYLGRRDEAIQWYARTALAPFLSETQRAAAVSGIEQPQVPKAPPKVPRHLVELPREGWTVSASHDVTPPAFAIDGDTRTRWTPMGDGQWPGEWLRLDLGKQVEGVAGAWLDDDAEGQSPYQNDAPRHCIVSVSRDGEWWKRVAEWQWTPNHYMETWWAPVSCRYVMFEQTHYTSPEWWAVYELHLYCARKRSASRSRRA